MTNDPYGCRNKDCALRIVATYSRHRSLRSRCRAYRRRLRPQTFQPEMPPLSSRHPSYVGVAGASASRSARQPRLLFRLVKAGLLHYSLRRARSPHSQSHSPTHRGGCRQYSKPTATFYRTSATHCPNPKPQRSGCRWTATLRQGSQPLRQLRAAYGPRRVEVGRLLSVLGPCARQ